MILQKIFIVKHFHKVKTRVDFERIGHQEFIYVIRIQTLVDLRNSIRI